ncbi:MAG: plasmid replication, integration and excision activator, partial [Actinomycetia bacterium]|nr:plasmid replication, integration and excision activator [Actinomycetes bacterium]
RPLWTGDVLVDDPDADRAEVAGVKVACYEVPETRLGEEVRFEGLTALPYVNNGRVALSWSADAMVGAGKTPKVAANPAA